MATGSSSPALRPDCVAVVDEYVRRLPGLGLGSLSVAHQLLQSRLGTAAERPCDRERVQWLGDEINRRQAALPVGTGSRPSRQPPASFSP